MPQPLIIVALYPLLAYTYHLKYDDWVKSEEWTFIYCVLVFAGHGLSFLTTAWSAGVNARISYTTVRCSASILGGTQLTRQGTLFGRSEQGEGHSEED